MLTVKYLRRDGVWCVKTGCSIGLTEKVLKGGFGAKEVTAFDSEGRKVGERKQIHSGRRWSWWLDRNVV